MAARNWKLCEVHFVPSSRKLGRKQKTAISVAGNLLECNRKKLHRTVGQYMETETRTSIQKLKKQPRPAHCQVSVLLYYSSAPNYQLGGKFDPSNMQLGTATMNQA